MKLYNFLLSKMLTYGNKIAFANSNITYRKLIKIVKEQSKKYKEKGKLIHTTKNEKEKQYWRFFWKWNRYKGVCHTNVRDNDRNMEIDFIVKYYM